VAEYIGPHGSGEVGGGIGSYGAYGGCDYVSPSEEDQRPHGAGEDGTGEEVVVLQVRAEGREESYVSQSLP